jgi:hypothetical protein
MMVRRVFLRKTEQHKLNAKAVRILELLANGLSADEVVAVMRCTAQDVVRAAELVVREEKVADAYRELRERVAKLHPRAHEEWSALEDAKVLQMYKERKTIRQIAAAVERHHDAVKCRLQVLCKSD